MSSRDDNRDGGLKWFDNKAVLIIFIILVVLSALSIKSWIKGNKDGVEVKATITNIRHIYSARTRKRIPYYKYEYNGKKYENVKGINVDVSNKVGDEVTITINPDKPKEIYETSTSSLLYVIGFVIFAFLFMKKKN